MAVEIWVASLPNKIYRFSAADGTAVNGGVPYDTPHAGILVPITTAVIWAPDGQIVRKVNGTGVVAATYGAYSQSGNVVTAGGPEHLAARSETNRRMIVVASTTEVWCWDGMSGVAQVFDSGTGAYKTTYRLASGQDIAYVTVS